MNKYRIEGTLQEGELVHWIQTDMEDMGDKDELEYKITIRRMTRKEINELPEWGS